MQLGSIPFVHSSIYEIQLSTLSKANKCWKVYGVKSLILIVRVKWLELNTNSPLLGEIIFHLLN